MLRHVTLEKPVGETPLMAIERWKEANSAYADLPAAYAGRLDPMASGKLLVLLGDECKKQKEYTALDKEYEIEVLLGVGSDTGDVLGLIELSVSETRLSLLSLEKALSKERGAHTRAYPAFSSKTVDGKPLFLHTLEGTLAPTELPTHTEHIYAVDLIDSKMMSKSELQASVASLLDRVPRTTAPSKKLGEDFRVDAVRDLWETTLNATEEREFTVIRLHVLCASGTYMRSLAGRIGESLGTKGLALSIRRTAIGHYVPLWRMGFWRKQY